MRAWCAATISANAAPSPRAARSITLSPGSAASLPAAIAKVHPSAITALLGITHE
jgi:hypothetical protein